MLEDLKKRIEKMKVGNKANHYQIIKTISECPELSMRAADIVIGKSMTACLMKKKLSTACIGIGQQISGLVQTEEDVNGDETPKTLIRLGADMLNELAELGHIRIYKENMVDKKFTTKHAWFIESHSAEFYNEMITLKKDNLYPTDGYVEWERPIMTFSNGSRIDIVKKARSHNILNKYRYSEMPMVYDTLNRLGSTEWKVNQSLLSVLENAPEGFMTPAEVSIDRKVSALAFINSTQRKAIYIKEMRFKEIVEKDATFNKKLAEKYATSSATKYSLKSNHESNAVISDWSKRYDFEKSITLAKSYGDQTLNFLYNCDSRGRIYCFNGNYLTPQGSDVAKSLLEFANPKPVSVSDLSIVIANHAGQDKLSFDDRLQWVNDNHDYILEVGSNTWSTTSMEWLKETGIASETKSRLQFIAACIEFVKLTDHVADGNTQESFFSSIPVAYDATNSGLQVLSIIGRDDYIAPYVNVCPTPKPGDVYQLIGNAVADKSPLDVLNCINSGSKLWRSIVKRNVMTKSYAATRFGMGTQQWEDKPDVSDNNSVEKAAWSSLTFEDCIKLGATTYDTCSEFLSKAHQLMETCQTAASYNNNAVITWTLPNGFTAFQSKPTIKDTGDNAKVSIGGKKATLKILTVLDKGDKQKHASAIAPDVVHSLDAWLLTTVVEHLPRDANLAFVHDAFGSDSIYGSKIGDAARVAYLHISSREVFKLLLKQISDGVDIELPEPGTLDPMLILESEYIVC